MHPQYASIPQPLTELYAERDALAWYYRASALVSAWIALAGYIVFGLVFTAPEVQLHIPHSGLVAMAAIFLLTGYGAITITAFYSRNLLFSLDSVLYPILNASFMGIVVTAVSYTTRQVVQDQSKALLYIPLATAAVTTLAAAALCFLTRRRLNQMRGTDAQSSKYNHVPRWEGDTKSGRYKYMPRWERGRQSSAGHGDAGASTTELLPMYLSIPEDEAQRQQLLRLLLSREAADAEELRRSRGQSTYQITLPGENGAPTGSDRPRAESNPSSSSRWSLMSKLRRDSSSTVETFKAPRERRREEIERSSVSLTPGQDRTRSPTPGRRDSAFSNSYG